MLRRGAVIAIVFGATGCVALFLRASEHPPPVLVVLFILWLISPFVLLGWMHAASARWASATQTTLHVVTLAIALASLAIYSGLLRITSAGAPRAAPFVVTAPASWLLIAVVVSLAALVSRRS